MLDIEVFGLSFLRNPHRCTKFNSISVHSLEVSGHVQFIRQKLNSEIFSSKLIQRGWSSTYKKGKELKNFVQGKSSVPPRFYNLAFIVDWRVVLQLQI